MKATTAWRRWTTGRDPEAGAALEQRYRYLPDAPAALEEFAGRPGSFADFARRRSLGPPAEPGPVLATAVLCPELRPCYPTLSRRYAPAAPPVAPQPDRAAAPQQEHYTAFAAVADREELIRQEEEPVHQVEAAPAAPALIPLADNAVPPPTAPAPAPPTAAPALRVRDLAPRRPGLVLPRRPAGPHQAAEVRVLRYWRDALSTIHRITRPDSNREVGAIRLAVEDGCLKLFGRDASRAHWVSVPARTVGAAQIAVDRADVLMREWGRAGRLSIFDEWLVFEPASGGCHWAPVVPAAMPAIPDDLGIAGAVLHRDDLAAALGEATGRGRPIAELPTEVRLRGAADGLLVDAGRGTVILPAAYVHGLPDVRVAPRWLLEAVSACPSEEVSLEMAGPYSPLTVTSGGFTAVLAPRTEEPLL